MGLEKGQAGRRSGGSGEVGKEQAGRRPGGAAAAPAPCAGGSRPKGGTACGPMPAPCRGMPRKRGSAGRGGLCRGRAGRQRPGEGTLLEPGGGAMGGDISRCAPRKPVQGAEGPQGNPPGGRVWGRPEAAPYGGEAAGPAGLCPPDLAGCSKRRGFCTGTCTKICGGGSNPLHFGSRYDKINVESCSAAYFFLHTKKTEGGRPPCEALL